MTALSANAILRMSTIERTIQAKTPWEKKKTTTTTKSKKYGSAWTTRKIPTNRKIIIPLPRYNRGNKTTKPSLHRSLLLPISFQDFCRSFYVLKKKFWSIFLSFCSLIYFTAKEEYRILISYIVLQKTGGVENIKLGLQKTKKN